MSIPDKIIRATSGKIPLRFVLVDLTATANAIGQKHGARAYSLGLLAESAIASLFLSSGLKFPGTVSLRVNYSGDLSFVQADTTPQGLVRATIPQDELRAAKDFELLLSPQSFRVVKIDEHGKRVQESIVEAASLSMAANLSAYMVQSEQVRSAVGIMARPNAHDPSRLDFAVGFMVEAFPDLDEKHFVILESVVRNLPSLENFFAGDHYRLDDLLDQLAGPYEMHVVKEIEPVAYCPCSKVRTLESLSSLQREDLEELAETCEDLEIICDFCRTPYVVTVDDMKELLERKRSSP